MCEYYHVVPWYDSAEWQHAYSAIYSEPMNKQEALSLLLLWKARSPSLPSGIESTLSLLEVHVQDTNSTNNITDDHLLRLAYSSAVMRFVNHMLDSETVRGASLYQAARNLGVPDWVIDLRHDTAHSNNLPSLTLLRSASEISLQWLQKNYWDKHKEFIQDYKSGQKHVENIDDNRINALIYFYSCLSICKHCKIKKISDIPDPSMQESILNDANDLLVSLLDLSNIQTVSVANLINITDVHAKKYLKAKNTIIYVNRALLGEDSLFMSLDLVKLLSHDAFVKNKLSRRFVHCFEVLLTFLHTNDLIFELVLALIEMTQNCDDPKKCRLAALWISELLASMKKSKQFLERLNKIGSDSTSKKRKDLKQMYYHWFPNERTAGLILDLHKPVPTKLTDIYFLQPIISSYNPYLTYFVNDLLVMVEPKIPKEVSNKICILAKLISAPENFPFQENPVKIYTVADLKIADNADFTNNEFISSTLSVDVDTEEYFSGIWKIASKSHSWSSCPIGQVPWHQKNVDVEMCQEDGEK